MTNFDLAEIKVNSTFGLSLLTKQQLADLKHMTGKDMGEIISDLVAAEHARLTKSNPPVAPATRPSASTYPAIPVGG